MDDQRYREWADYVMTEIHETAAYIDSILPGEIDGPVSARSLYRPSQLVGGDCFDYRWIDDGDHFLVYLLDVSGHGLLSAFIATTVHNVIRSGMIPNSTLCKPGNTLSALNRHFQMDDVRGHYMTMWFGVYQFSSRTMTYAGAGHPPVFAFSDGHLTRLESQSPPLGVLENTHFSSNTYEVPPDSDFLLYSDGALDLPLPEGRWFELEDFADLCGELAADLRGGAPQWFIKTLADRLLQISATAALSDDCSLIQLHVD